MSPHDFVVEVPACSRWICDVTWMNFWPQETLNPTYVHLLTFMQRPPWIVLESALESAKTQKAFSKMEHP